MTLLSKELGEVRLSLGKVFNKYRTLMELPLDFGTGENLYPSEAHVIEAIGAGAADTVTGLAAVLGVTKGAVSQMASKLERRHYLEKEPRNGPGREVRIGLSARGRTAYRAHAELHRRMEASLAEAITRGRPDDLAVLSRLLTALEGHLDEWLTTLAQNDRGTGHE